MKFGKRFRVSAVLLVCLSMIALAACSSRSEPEKSEATTVPSAQPEQSAETPAPTEIAKIYIYANQGRPLDKSAPEAVEEVRQYIIDQIGVEPVIIEAPKGTELEKLNLLLSANERLDTFGGSWSDYKSVIIPLNDLLDEFGQDIKQAWPEEAWAQLTDKEGNIWGIPRLLPTAALPIWIRQDWLDLYNLPMPTTIDELENILKVFKENDKIPLLTESSWFKGIFNAFAGGFTQYGYSNWLDSADNKIKIAELQPGYEDFLAKMADWYQKGYIFKESFSAFDMEATLKTNRVGVFASWYSNITYYQPRIVDVHPEMNYVPIPDIKGPQGPLQTVFAGGAGGYLVSKKAEHPEAVIKFINWQYQNIENHLTADLGIIGKTWNWVDKEKGLIEKLGENKTYHGDFNWSLGLPNERQYLTTDPLIKMQMDYLNGPLLDYGNAKLKFDHDVVYDQNILKEKVPNIADLDRLREEEAIKFIMGARSLGEFGQFIEEMKKAGLDEYQEFLTEQYFSQK